MALLVFRGQFRPRKRGRLEDVRWWGRSDFRYMGYQGDFPEDVEIVFE